MNQYSVILKSGKEIIITAADCEVYRSQRTGEITKFRFDNSNNFIYLNFDEIACITKITK